MRITVTKDYATDENGRIYAPFIDTWTDPDARATADEEGRLTVAGINTSAIYAAGNWQQVRIEREAAE